MTATHRTDEAYALSLDEADPLRALRARFHIPKQANGTDTIYLCGNSLGLQPVATEAALLQELHDWKTLGVEGHFHAKNPWMPYHAFLSESLARLVGALPSEVVAMNTLTVNLHLMMVSFYRPTPARHRIIIEKGAFPSDRYAMLSQLKFHGYDESALIELSPRSGEATLRTDDILATIAEHGASVAVILLGGVNYYTGQCFDMATITQAGHKAGCMVGFDLAHAAGNVPLSLHDWGVDFACWCSYKYLNSGPGSVAGCFVHERHGNNPSLPRFTGWWGHDQSVRFKMEPDFVPMQGAEGWQLSNPPILSLAAVKASLAIFDEVGMDALRAKSLALTGYLLFLLDALGSDAFHILTPRHEAERGCQLSIVVRHQGRAAFDALTHAGVICDWREPDCIRIAPVPLYNSFTEIYRFVSLFAQALSIPSLQKVAS